MPLLRRVNRLLKRNGRLLVRGGSSPVPPEPSLPPYTIRAKFTSGYTPDMGDSQTLVDAQENIWDITKNSTNWAGLFSLNSNLLEVIDANTTGVTNMSCTFQKTNITSIPQIDTSSVTDMSSIFQQCSQLTSVPALNTSNVVNMYGMFAWCTSLQSVPMMDTSKVTDMGHMFANDESLESVPMYDTSKVTNMECLFEGCEYLTTIPAIDTRSAVSMNSMFSGCTELTGIPQLNTSNVTDMYGMFAYCEWLTNVPLLDTSKVTDMGYMFYGCESLETIPLLNTSRVTNMEYMFYDCYWLGSFPRFDLSSVVNMNYTFCECHNCETGAYELYLDASSKQNVPSHNNTFYNCYYCYNYDKIPLEWGGGYVEPQDTVTIGGVTYRTVERNGHVWLAENLDYMFEGCESRGIAGRTGYHGSCALYYNNDQATYGRSGKNYGLLYSWEAMRQLVTNKETLIPGWHVPTQSEFLADFPVRYGYEVKSTEDWVEGAGTNEFGFNALPAGIYNATLNDKFESVGGVTNFWCSDNVTDGTNQGYCRKLSGYSNKDKFQAITNAYNRYDYMFSIRLVKDY